MKTKLRKPRKKLEAQDQKAIAEYLRYTNVLFTISIAGVYLTVGQRAELNRMGYVSGTPDIMIFEPRKGYRGLFIELKKLEKVVGPGGKVKIIKGNVSLEQLQWQHELIKRGYKSAICFGKDEALAIIQEYLK